MRLVKVLGLALMAVFALSAATATGASASSFEAGETSGLLTIKEHGLQQFITPTGTLNCTKLRGHGSWVTKTKLTQIATVSYTGCSTTIGTVEEPINAEYEFSADGLNNISILKTITIQVLATGLTCKIIVPAQSGLDGVKYDNLPGFKAILLLSEVSGITSSDSGAICPVKYTTEKTATYTGNALISVVAAGGQIKWVQ